MLVVIRIRNVHLANSVVSVVPVHFRKHADFKPPVAGYTDIVKHVPAKTEFPRKGITEAIHEIQVVPVSEHTLESP